MNVIGVRREDKSVWERRVPLTPGVVEKLVKQGIAVRVQPSDRRVFPDDAYRAAGAAVDDDLSPCDVIFGVKEIPAELLLPGKTYIFFAHVIKGQPYNMEMLRTLMEKKANLIDYERIVDSNGRRLVFFGRFAGLAGMIDALHTFGARARLDGFDTPLSAIGFAHTYDSLDDAKSAVEKAGERIAAGDWPADLPRLVCGFAGYGNVSRGAQEIFDLLRPETVDPDVLERCPGSGPPVKVVFREEHMVRRKGSEPFALQEYYDEPEKYEPRFEEYLPFVNLLMNTIYWEERYPRLVTNNYLKRAWERGARTLKVIGEISCDVAGSVECLVKVCDPGNPVYVYEPLTGAVRDGFEGDGPVLLAVDILPCELPRESSVAFSEALEPFIEPLAAIDFTAPVDTWELPPPLREALIMAGGELTEPYAYLNSYMNRPGGEGSRK